MSEIRTACADGILRVDFNRPDKKNAITAAMYQTLADTLGNAAEDRAVRVVLFGSTSAIFTAGNDLGDFRSNPPRDGETPVARFLRALSLAEKPLVAAVGGPAVGIGTTMLLHCDFVVAAQGARFHMPFVDLALVPEAASSFLLPRLAGWQAAAEMLMLGAPVTAGHAQSIGIVHRVVEPDALDAAALGIARTLAAKPPEALRLTKRLMKDAMRDGVAAALAREGKVFAERLGTPEAKEAFAAFFEKRKPDFSRFG